MNGEKPGRNEGSSPPRTENDKIYDYPASRTAAGELTPIREQSKGLVPTSAPLAEEHKVEAGLA